MQEQALRQGQHGHREQRAPEPEEVLAHDQREHHQHGVDLGCHPDDLRIEQVGLHLVNADDPEQDPEGSEEVLRQADHDRGDGAQDGAKDRDDAHHRGDQGQNRPVLQAKEPEADGGEQAVHHADQELPAHDSGQTAVDAGQQPIKGLPRVRRRQQPKGLQDRLTREHQIGGDHQRQKEQKDAASHLAKNGLADLEQVERVAFDVLDGLPRRLPREHGRTEALARVRGRGQHLPVFGVFLDDLHARSQLHGVRPVGPLLDFEGWGRR